MQIPKSQIAAGIVSFNPEISKLNDNIKHIIEQVDTVLIFDNGSQNIFEIRRLINDFTRRIILIENKKNEGIAVALNRMCKWSKDNGYKFILTLDQDSICPSNTIAALQESMEEDVAISAPNILYINNERFSELISGIKEVEWVITSASLTNLRVWEELGGFDELLFIDGVDRDYCLRAKLRNYRILRNGDVALLHELGNLQCRRFLGMTLYITNHSAIRKYYMVRNAIYLDKKLNKSSCAEYILKILIKTVLFESKAREKVKYIFKGIYDGIRM